MALCIRAIEVCFSADFSKNYEIWTQFIENPHYILHRLHLQCYETKLEFWICKRKLFGNLSSCVMSLIGGKAHKISKYRLCNLKLMNSIWERAQTQRNCIWMSVFIFHFLLSAFLIFQSVQKRPIEIGILLFGTIWILIHIVPNTSMPDQCK